MSVLSLFDFKVQLRPEVMHDLPQPQGSHLSASLAIKRGHSTSCLKECAQLTFVFAQCSVNSHMSSAKLLACEESTDGSLSIVLH